MDYFEGKIYQDDTTVMILYKNIIKNEILLVVK